MLQSDSFPPERLEALTIQVNSWLGEMIRTHQLRSSHLMGSESAMLPGKFELGEQFWMACLNDREIRDVNSLDRDLGELVVLTGRRHHQLKYNKTAIAYARSLVKEGEALCQLFATKLAPKVQEAIEWLDEHEHEFPQFAEAPWRVRLITIPTFHAHVFLIQKLENESDVPTGDSYVFVISAPPWMDNLPKQRLLRTREFLLAFKGKTPIIGVPGNTDVSERQSRVQIDYKER